MSSIGKFLLPLAIISALATGIYLVSGNNDLAPPKVEVVEPVVQQPTTEAKPTTAVQAPQNKPVADDIQRRVASVPSEAHSDAPQGVRGRVLTPDGKAAVAVDVMLMEAANSDPLKVFLAQRTGQKFTPAARGLTAQDGSFALGIDRPGQTFDLRVITDNYPEFQFTGIKVRDGDWFEAGVLTLKQGIVLQGRVTAEGIGAGISGADVYMAVANNNFQALPTPGRERGIKLTTDGNGFYRFETAPRDGLVTITAEAAEYAAGEQANFQVKADQLNECNIELARGLPISGFVIDAGGKPVANAQINASALSAKTPLTVNLRSQQDGAFLTPTLREGPYRLTVTAGGYEEKTAQAMSGENNVKVVMEQRGMVKLRVLSTRGMPLKSYGLSLRRFFSNNPGAIGKVLEFPDNKRITPADYDGEWAQIQNIPVGEFVFQITENDHAKTLTPSFQVTSNMMQSPQVEVTLTMGAGIIGIVQDDTGKPVANAIVATDMNGGIAADGGFFEIFKPFLPDKHTTTQTKTDGQGHFKINRLAFADYMLRISHPDFCEGSTIDIKLDGDGQMKDIGIVSLARGAVMEGHCLLGNQAAGQVKVQISPPEGSKPELDNEGRVKPFFSASAITDNEGYYRMLKRVPPGSYKIHASRQAGNNDIFTPLLHMKATSREMVITAGQQQSMQNFELPAQ